MRIFLLQVNNNGLYESKKVNAVLNEHKQFSSVKVEHKPLIYCVIAGNRAVEKFVGEARLRPAKDQRIQEIPAAGLQDPL